jgi:ribosome-binding ATPase YchF (GTP1/OBG family)
MTAKPVLYVCNVEEARQPPATNIAPRARGLRQVARHAVVISAAIEAEVAQLPAEDQADYPRRSAWKKPASTA